MNLLFLLDRSPFRQTLLRVTKNHRSFSFCIDFISWELGFDPKIVHSGFPPAGWGVGGRQGCRLLGLHLEASLQVRSPKYEVHNCQYFYWQLPALVESSKPKSFPSLEKHSFLYILSSQYYSCAYVSKWHNFVKDNLGLQWLLWGTLYLNKCSLLRDILEKRENRISWS